MSIATDPQDNLLALLEPTTTEIAEVSHGETAVDPDGYIYSLATGEILGQVDVQQQFVVDSLESADWVLELKSKLDSELVGVDSRISAVQEMLLNIRRAVVRKLSYWDYRFAPSLEAFARKQIAGQKSKTAQFNWGQVSFRKTPGSNQILDMERAVEFVEMWEPKRVKIEKSVTVKDVLATIELIAEKTGEPPEKPTWLVSSGERDNVTISTGIQLKLSKGAKK